MLAGLKHFNSKEFLSFIKKVAVQIDISSRHYATLPADKVTLGRGFFQYYLENEYFNFTISTISISTIPF